MAMTPREVFLETCRFGSPDRHFRWECVGPWGTTVERWRTEGYPKDADFLRFFGMDYHVGFLNFQGETKIASGFTNSPHVPGFEHRVLAEDGGYCPSLDHTAPPDISFDNFRYFVDLIRSVSADVYGG